MRKIVSILLAMLLVAAVFAGCSPAETTSSESSGSKSEASQSDAQSSDGGDDSLLNPVGTLPIAKEPLSMTLTLLVGPGDKAPNDMWFFQHYEELTNIKWDITGILSADWPDKKSIVIATNDYTDVYWGNLNWTTGEILSYGTDGIFIDLTDYLDYAPDFVKEMDLVEGSWSNIICPNGAMYSFASVNPVNWYSGTDSYIRQSWLDALELDVPETLDQYYEALVAFKENDMDGDGDANNEVPLSAIGTTANMRRNFFLAYGFAGAAAYTNNISYDTRNNDEIVYVPLTERYKDYLTYMTKLYAEGLLDVNTYSQEESQYLARGSEGIYGSFMNNKPHYVDPDRLDDYSAIMLRSDESAAPISYQASGIGYGKFVVTDTCQYPEAAVMWVNLFYQAEHAFDILYGPIIIDGSDEVGSESDPLVGSYITLDENGNYVGFNNSTWTENYAEEYTLWDWYCLDHPGNGAFNAGIGEGYYLNTLFPGRATTAQMCYDQMYKRYLDAAADDVSNRGEGWWRSQDTALYYDYIRYGLPTAYLNEEQQKWLDQYQTILEDYVYQMEAKFITGAANLETEYDAFIEELKKLGAEDYQQIYRDVYS